MTPSDWINTVSDKRAIEIMKESLNKGYKYVVRARADNHLMLFSLKPKKYKEDFDWGYKQSDINNPEAKMCITFKNEGFQEINYSNQKPKSIEDVISKFI